jgi:branched-chain amino acid transport system substrate-binding protein
MPRRRLASPLLLARRALLAAFAVLALAPWSAGAEGAPPVRIGYAISRTGPNVPGVQGTSQESNYLLWAEQVNAAGGLDVQGKRRKVELVSYDDESDVDKAVSLYEKLMTTDKVDLILPPWGTAAVLAVAPVATRHGYPLLPPTASSHRLLELKLPYLFLMLQQPDAMMAALADLLQAKGVKTAGVIYLQALIGQEHLDVLVPMLKRRNIAIVERRSYPPDVKDLTPLLKALKAKDVDALIAIGYPPDTFLTVKQAKEIGFNPKLVYTSVGTAFQAFKELMGPDAEDVMGMGSWNARTSARAKAYVDAHVARFHREPDRWASGAAWAALEVLQQAVAKVGLDRKAIRDDLASSAFETVIGTVKFKDGENVGVPGTVSQWQKGEFEVVWPLARATGQAIFPKPAWK